ncbi:hypothetical protein EXS71_01370 [Candidatus Uhrbacteria bacterium]|nr:hypothetical protein [Candidatus Uhrbacteria bacterium]
MKRSIAIFLWILIGALASGLAVGYFLHRANNDRGQLATEKEAAKRQTEETLATNRKLVEEANQKLAGADEEVAKAQERIKRYEIERDLLLRATRLDKPSSFQLKSWKTFLSLPLGISLQVPPGSYATSDQALVSVRINENIPGENDWLNISTYDPTFEQSRLQDLVDSTSSVRYLVDGSLLTGVRGRIRDTAAFGYVLHAQAHGVITHLVWVRPRVGLSDQRMLQTIATLNFRP